MGADAPIPPYMMNAAAPDEAAEQPPKGVGWLFFCKKKM